MQGATDYLALPAPSAHGARNYMLSYVTDRPGGFTESEVADLTRISQRLPVLFDMFSQRTIARNVLNAYLGAKTGRKVLEGQIRRGTGEEISAVLWSSDQLYQASVAFATIGATVVGAYVAILD